MESQSHAVPPGGAWISALRPAVRRFIPATGKVTRLPRGELKGAGKQNHCADRNRHRPRQRRLPHLHLRQREAKQERFLYIATIAQSALAFSEFSAKDHLGNPVTLSGLKGKTVVLWFYPKADTPG